MAIILIMMIILWRVTTEAMMITFMSRVIVEGFATYMVVSFGFGMVGICEKNCFPKVSWYLLSVYFTIIR